LSNYTWQQLFCTLDTEGSCHELENAVNHSTWRQLGAFTKAGYCLVTKLSITTGIFSHWIIPDSVINDRRRNQNQKR